MKKIFLSLCIMSLFIVSNAFAASNDNDDNEKQFKKAMELIDKGKIKKGADILEKLAKVDYAPACHELGKVYMPSFPGDAIPHFKKVIKLKHPETGSYTEEETYFQKDTQGAIMTMFPPGSSRDDVIATTKDAADCGFENQMFLYAGYLETSKGKEAARNIVKYYEGAARHGMGAAAYHLAMLYEDGTILDKDLKKAAEFYQKASETCMPDCKPVKFAFITITEEFENTMLPREQRTKKEPVSKLYKVTTGDEPRFVTILRLSDEFMDIDTHMRFSQVGSSRGATNIFSIKKGSTIDILDTEITDAHHELKITYEK